ncbi:MAG TPA: ATP-binding protein [Aquihabitans sp.]|nr:ATP-binding protein [Aquihabitans sp.]
MVLEHAPATDEVIELELPARPEVVSVARLVVGAVAAVDPLFDDERAADLRLAVSEACTNAIQAQIASPDRARGRILLRCVAQRGRIELRVRDHGGGFDPDRLPRHPAVTDPARLDHEGGLGIPLIRLLADELEFVASPGGTTVVMVFGPRMPTGRVIG